LPRGGRGICNNRPIADTPMMDGDVDFFTDFRAPAPQDADAAWAELYARSAG
jgi:hypothetical protein